VSERRRSPYVQPAWPTSCPRPGSPAWPDGAINWLRTATPHDDWRHRALGDHPWPLFAFTAIALRTQLDALRAQYRTAGRTAGGVLPAAAAKRLRRAFELEGERITRLLAEVMAVEEALAPGAPVDGPETP
jgi:hypothetical protein